jgi:hypothetical protein
MLPRAAFSTGYVESGYFVNESELFAVLNCHIQFLQNGIMSMHGIHFPVKLLTMQNYSKREEVRAVIQCSIF